MLKANITRNPIEVRNHKKQPSVTKLDHHSKFEFFEKFLTAKSLNYFMIYINLIFQINMPSITQILCFLQEKRF